MGRRRFVLQNVGDSVRQRLVEAVGLRRGGHQAIRPVTESVLRYLLLVGFDPDPNPDEALSAKQMEARLRAVVLALAEQDRFCLHLRAEGLRYRKIAGRI